jgi:hypothetical protein
MRLIIFTGQCAFNTSTLAVANGFISNTDEFRTNSAGLATGSLVYTCNPGFMLNPTIGSRLTCLSNGAWTALPVCQCQ